MLCFLEGKTNEEAAAELGWPAGSVARPGGAVRTLLRERLLRRGVPPAAVLVTAVSPTVAPAAEEATLHTVLQDAMGQAVAAPVRTLTEGVMQTMVATRVCSALVFLLSLMVVCGTGALVWNQWLAVRSCRRPRRCQRCRGGIRPRDRSASWNVRMVCRTTRSLPRSRNSFPRHPAVPWPTGSAGHARRGADAR